MLYTVHKRFYLHYTIELFSYWKSKTNTLIRILWLI